jgi:hypothetical protein
MGASLSILLLTLWVIDGIFKVRVSGKSQDWWLALYNGAILVEWDAHLYAPQGWDWTVARDVGAPILLWTPQACRISGGEEDGKLIGIIMPLWIPFVVAAFPTALSFVSTRQKPGGESCPECGYNLTGLREPRCPECGTPFEPSMLTGVSSHGTRNEVSDE